MLPFKKAKQYLISPVRMEPERVGNFGIEIIDHPSGYKETAISTRTSYLSGHKRASIIHPNGVRRHYLKSYDGDTSGTLMSDIAQEMMDFAEPIHRMRRLVAPSKVLIGGLGLGYIAQWAHRLGHTVTVVENEPDIVKLTGKYFPKDVTIVEADLYDYLREADDVRRFNFAMFDIWYGTSESSYWSNVVPARRAWFKAGGDPKRLWCWKERDEMWGQVYRSTVQTWQWRKHAQQQEKNSRGESFWTPHQLFLNALDKWHPEADQQMVELFAASYVRGLADSRRSAARWEGIWGESWNAVITKAEEQHGEDKTAQNTPA